MYNNVALNANFERNKNLKASGFTLLVCLLLFIVFFFIEWTSPIIPPPVISEGIEVNLGNSETGSGDIAPKTPGDPAPDAAATQASTPASQPTPEKEDIIPNDNETEATTTVNKVNKTIAKPKPTNTPPIVVKKPTATATPTPPEPKPKAAMGKYTGGNGNGGNGADSYNGVKNQGIAGGNGDQGKANGNPNSDSYTGNAAAGNSGVSIRSGLGGRRFAKLPSFEDDFNEPAKVAVDIKVDKQGNVTDVVINPKGTTTTNGQIRAIALRKASQLKMNAGNEEEQTGTIVFNFKLKG